MPSFGSASLVCERVDSSSVLNLVNIDTRSFLDTGKVQVPSHVDICKDWSYGILIVFRIQLTSVGAINDGTARNES